MATSDANGLPQFQGSDPADLEGSLNLLSAATSNAFNTQVRPYLVANNTARNALATKLSPSTQNPLLVWVKSSGRFEINTGSGWSEWPPPIPTINLPPTGKFPIAGTTSHKSNIPGGNARDISVSFGQNIIVADYVPLVSIRGTRGDIDRLYVTISQYNTTGLNAVVKNTTKTTVKQTIYVDWALIPK